MFCLCIPVVEFNYWSVICRCCCLFVLIHMHNSIKLTTSMGDRMLLFSNIQFHSFFPHISIVSILVSWATLSFPQLLLPTCFSPSLSNSWLSLAWAYDPDPFFWIPQTVTWSIPSLLPSLVGRELWDMCLLFTC